MKRSSLQLALLVVAFCNAGCLTIKSGPLKPASAPVPPTSEIELLDPGQSSSTVPAVFTQMGENGVNKVEVPQTIIVHRYYPSGDRSFQGPMFPGGPMIAAVNHPKTLERVYVPITLPPGAPRITYSHKSIIYDFGPQSVTLKFGICGQPNVSYSQEIQAVANVRKATNNAVETGGELVRATGIPQGVKSLGTGIKDSMFKAAEAIGPLWKTPVEQ